MQQMYNVVRLNPKLLIKSIIASAADPLIFLSDPNPRSRIPDLRIRSGAWRRINYGSGRIRILSQISSNL
jgi:hypothetical protein